MEKYKEDAARGIYIEAERNRESKVKGKRETRW